MSTRDDQDALEAAALMARYCDGEVRAFHALYEQLAPRILAYLVNLAGDRPTAEDLLQQSFMKLHEARATYVRNANPIPWLYTIAHRTCLDELRRRKRARVRVATGDAGLPEVPVGIQGVTEEAAEPAGPAEATLALAMQALQSLPANQRDALVLTKVHGRSHAEAASIVGTSVGAIKLRAHRGYVALRRVLGKSDSLGGEP